MLVCLKNQILDSFVMLVDVLMVAKHTNVAMCADDSTLHIDGSNLTIIEMNIQRDIKEVNNWCSLNNMAIDPTETKVIGTNQRLE